MTTKADIARAMDVDPALITRWEKRGMPVYSIDAARKWRESNIRPRVKPGSAGAQETPLAVVQAEPSAASQYWEARTRREIAEAATAELKLQELAGGLVHGGEVERAAFEASRLLRDMLLSVPSKMAAQLAATSSPQEVETTLRDELQHVLAELARLARSGLKLPEAA